MAGGQERILRRRIRSVQSTRKITKAMELIAASRIVRAQTRIVANRPFREGMERVLRLTAAADPTAAKRLLGTPESPRHVGILAVAGDRGLAGSYNSGVLPRDRATGGGTQEQRRPGDGVVGGQEGPSLLPLPRHRHGGVVRRASPTAPSSPTPGTSRRSWPHRSRRVTSTSFRWSRRASSPPGPSGSNSSSCCRFPCRREREEAPEQDDETLEGYTEFEPEPEKLLLGLAPRALEAEIFAALLEGAASFFTAQQRAMAAATDNADELVRTLTRVMNRARQDAITTEIMEIVGGAEALRQAKGA